MIATKAVAAILMTGLGSVAAGSAAYLESHSRALVWEAHPPAAPQALPPPRPPLRSPIPVSVEPEAVSLAPVVITARRPRLHAAPKAPATTIDACSEWHDLATGPAGRKVRTLCPH